MSGAVIVESVVNVVDNEKKRKLQTETENESAKKERCISLVVIAMPCKTPRFHKNQLVISKTGTTVLKTLANGDKCSVVVINDALNGDLYQEFFDAAIQVQRCCGKTAYGAMKPRSEVCYTVEGNSYVYSNIAHKTTKYPPHVLKVIPTFLQLLETQMPNNQFKTISNGIDIEYSNKFKFGGSVDRHKDDDIAEWGLILIYTLGQSRYLRVRNDETGQFYNVLMQHNSLVAMHGREFQNLYTHQVDKLMKDEPVGTRLSLNIRFT